MLEICENQRVAFLQQSALQVQNMIKVIIFFYLKLKFVTYNLLDSILFSTIVKHLLFIYFSESVFKLLGLCCSPIPKARSNKKIDESIKNWPRRS